MGIVYVLTNESMPGLVKIGMTDGDASDRVAQLYTTGVPLPFDVEYACRVDNPSEVEDALHEAFGPQRINPKREFFSIDPAQAIAILKLLHKPGATTEVTVAPSAIIDKESLAAAAEMKRRRPNLNFEEMSIPIGAVLVSTKKDGANVTVTSAKKVKLGDEEMSLTAATQKILGSDSPIRPSPHWRYNGKLLSAIYEETYVTPET